MALLRQTFKSTDTDLIFRFKILMSSQILTSSWLGTIFCCQTQNENSKENTSDNEEAVPFTKQENCDHQNGGTVEIPLKATKFQKRF